MDLANDTALITGSSGGIGEEFAHQLAQRRANLVLVARRLDKLEELRATLLARHPDIQVDVIAADLSVPGSGAKLAEQVGDRRIDVLINNAGVGLHGDFVDQDPDGNAAQIQLNCGTLVDLTARFLPAMTRARHGVIINVASTAAFQPTPSMAVYGATKAFVLSFTEALWQETKGNRGARARAVPRRHRDGVLRAHRRGVPDPRAADLEAGRRHGAQRARQVKSHGRFRRWRTRHWRCPPGWCRDG